jgi:hypothetical protein
MNEKTKKLIDKAGLKLVNNSNSKEKRDCTISKKEAQKFLELVVNACANIPTIMWDENLVNADVAVKIRNRILEEFGIEEE